MTTYDVIIFVNIVSDNGDLANSGLSSTAFLETKFIEILIKLHSFMDENVFENFVRKTSDILLRP